MKMTEADKLDKTSISVHDVQRLVKKKDEIEEQIKAYYDVLEDQGQVGMHGPLVDIEGYPRTDVDLYQIRTARHSISCLQNDHKAIMVEIEVALHNLHARERTKHAQDQEEAQRERMEQQACLPPPFARVDAVTPGSPAFQSIGAKWKVWVEGLQIGDEIIEFGSVNTNNFQNLQNIAAVVQHSEGNSISVAVIRNGQKVHLGLTPQRWAGRGLLGCNMVPLQR